MQLELLLCLASRQSMANVLPVLQLQPRRVCILATAEEQDAANNLKHLFQGKGILVEVITGLNAYDIPAVTRAAEQILGKTRPDAAMVNITGGTKLMALAAYEAAKNCGAATIYCNTRDKAIMHIHPRVPDTPLLADISIHDYLASYGYMLEDNKPAEDYEPLFQLLRQGALEGFCKATEIFRRHFDNPPAKTQKQFQQFKAVKDFANYYLYFGKERLAFDSKKFIMGDWLEYYVYDYIRKNITEKVMVGVKIISAGNVKNEVDVVFMHKGQLHFVSCKSGAGKQLDLFQLEGIRNFAGGTFGKAYFVAGKAFSQEDIWRGKELHITMGQVTNLPEIFG